MNNEAIFLDRDGVINAAIIKNGKPYPPSSLHELIIPLDVPDALKQLKSAGFMLICVTNQPDVARGTTPLSLVEAINKEIMKSCSIDEIRVCYHDDKDACQCRKPLPGLLLDAAYDYSLNLNQSFMIGDRWKDIEAGQRAGCKTIWIDQQYTEKSPNNAPDFIARNFKQAAEWVLNKKKEII